MPWTGQAGQEHVGNCRVAINGQKQGPEAGAYFNLLGFNDLVFSTSDLVVRRLRLLWLCPAVDRRSGGFAVEYLGIVWHWAG